MKNISIIYSQKEPNPAGMELVFGRMAESFRKRKIQSERIYLEELKDAGCVGKKSAIGNIAYFMTNDFDTEFYFKILELSGWSVVNRSGLEKKRTKFETQQVLGRNGVKVPESSDSANLWQGQFPVYIKSQKQLSHVRLAKDQQELSRSVAFFEKKREPYYFERAVDDGGSELHKIYYIAGKAFFSGKYRLSSRILDEISHALDLEIFSADIFISAGGAYRVIDINPAPGLYRSEEARTAFADYLRSM
jgi:hypothetical protein